MDMCPICKLSIEVIVRAFSHEPYLDGRNYDMICHCCLCVRRTVFYNPKTDDWMWYESASPDRLASVADLVADGFDKYEAEASIKGVKRLLKNPKTLIVPEGGVHIFESLLLDVSL